MYFSFIMTEIIYHYYFFFQQIIRYYNSILFSGINIVVLIWHLIKLPID